MRKAEIVNGRIVNVVLVHPEEVPEWCADWPDAGDAGPGWLLLPDGSFAPEVPFLSRDEAVEQIITMIDDTALQITGPVPEVERLSWIAKEQAARAHIEGRGTDALLLNEAVATGESADELARKIVSNADRYRAAVSRMTGLRRAAIADLNAENADARVVIGELQQELAAIVQAS